MHRLFAIDLSASRNLLACVVAIAFAGIAGPDAPASEEPPRGLLYFASYAQRDNTAPAANPHLLGALFTIYWSDVEKSPGVFDWTVLDRRMAPWTTAGKKIAIRIMWSSSGNWPDPAAKTPTPQFVLDEGAVTVRSDSSRTDIPLTWDPIYRRHAQRFLAEVARKFDGDPNILFVDVTPGAETNPYRFRRINVNEPQFKQRFASAAASDGRAYSHALWLETVKQSVDDAATAFKKTPLLVTLNVGSLDGPEQFLPIGTHCVEHGCYVGQNGLNARSYLDDSPRKRAFSEWDKSIKLYFEMVDASGRNTGSLLDVMKAAERIGCDYLGVYAVDVLRGTRRQANFDPAYEEALAYGAKALGGTEAASQGDSAQEPSADHGQASAVESDRTAASAEPETALPTITDFRLEGDRWTCMADGKPLGGILLKPDGPGPFPAVIISHGLGGSAGSFGLTKARELVKSGLVCIAVDYTHMGAGGPRQPPGERTANPKARPTKGAPRAGGRPPDAGASPENVRRALAAIAILRSQANVDERRVGAYGHSMGGFVTIGLAAKRPDLLRAAAISGSGVAPRAGFAAPTLDEARKVRTPFLIMHGSLDQVVRPAQSEDFKRVLDESQVANARHVFEGHNHPIDQTNREELFALIRRWFTQHGVLERE